MNTDFLYKQVSEDEDLEELAYTFCLKHGDDERGLIPEDEFNRLYDLLGEQIAKYASFGDDEEGFDFMGSRLVEKLPYIMLVAEDDSDPASALKSALETIKLAHRPLAIAFDYYPETLLIIPQQIVYSTFGIETLTGQCD